LNKRDTLAIRRDLLASNTKKLHWPKKQSRGEASHCWSFKEGDVPWILKKDDLSMENDAISGVKAPSLYGLTLQHFFIVYENLLRLKSHDHINLVRVCMLNTRLF